MSWNHKDNRNLFFKLDSKLELRYSVIKTPKSFPEKPTLTVFGMQQLPDIENTDSKEELSCLKWTKCKGLTKACVNFKTDTEKLKIVVYRYRNKLYIKDNEVGLKLTEKRVLLTKRVYLLSYIDIFYKRCFVLGETTVQN